MEKYQIYYWINKGFFGLKRSILNYARKRKKKDKVEEKKVRILGKSIEERQRYKKNRYEIIRLIEDKTVKSVNKALKEVLKEYEIKSITENNGLEFARLYEVFDYEKIYYAHLYSSY